LAWWKVTSHDLSVAYSLRSLAGDGLLMPQSALPILRDDQYCVVISQPRLNPLAPSACVDCGLQSMLEADPQLAHWAFILDLRYFQGALTDDIVGYDDIFCARQRADLDRPNAYSKPHVLLHREDGASTALVARMMARYGDSAFFIATSDPVIAWAHVSDNAPMPRAVYRLLRAGWLRWLI